MSKPTRDELKRQLLESHQQERRAPAERARGLDALLAADATPPPKSKARTWGSVAIAALAAALALWWWRTPAPVPTPVPEPVVVIIDAGAAPEPLDAGVDDVTVVMVDAGPAVEDTPDASVVKSAPSRPPALPAEPADLLARELALLDAARKQLREAPPDALLTLETYAKEFPAGAMRTEAAMVRVEALMKLGRVEEANAVARKLMKADRDGLVTKRLSRLLDAGTP